MNRMIHRHLHPVNQAIYDRESRGDAAIRRFVGGFGSVRFLFWQTVAIGVWVTLNTVGLVRHWDPYPFILLNLAFSTQAAYAAPLILLAQNKQEDRDRIKREHDFTVNETALAEIRADKELTREVRRLTAEVRRLVAESLATDTLE